MKLLRQWGIVLGILLFCHLLVTVCHLPLPGNIMGLLLLLGLLEFKIIKPEQIEEPTSFLLDHLAFFFIPSAINIIVCYHKIASCWWQISLICILSTIAVMGVAGKVTQWVNTYFVSSKDEEKPHVTE